MTKQMTKIAMMLVLIVGLTASAATAQNKDGAGFGAVGIFDGIQTAEGTCKTVNEMCYGNTFLLNSFGEWETHHLSISVDYLNIQNQKESELKVLSGSWSLVVIRDNQYVGTLYGEVSNGAVVLVESENGEAISKQVQLNLLSTGGLGKFQGKEGENISGMYEAMTDLKSKETTGSASFGF